MLIAMEDVHWNPKTLSKCEYSLVDRERGVLDSSQSELAEHSLSSKI